MVSEGLIFDVKRYAINDGPGIRVTIFLKGCNLSCPWCHNPEGITPDISKLYTASRCIGCGTCVTVCPVEALSLKADRVITDQEKCTLCGKCAEVCPTKAFEMSGQVISVAGIMEILEKERIFMEQSGGGVTFSGGEPLLQPEFLLEILKECGRRGIHRTVDTAGHVRPATLQEIARETELFLFDLKIMEEQAHREFTGVTNALILDNLRLLSESGAKIIIRIPLIGGVNDHEANAIASVQYLLSLPNPVSEVHLLPYHAIARGKFQKMGTGTAFEEFDEPSAAVVNFYLQQFTAAGIPVQVGG